MGWTMRTVILGAGGQLATDMEMALSDGEVLPLSHAQLDVCDHERVRKTLSAIAPDAVVNTAAFHRVDDCEFEVEKAFRVNTYAVRNLAQVCRDLDCTLVHLSTDYVFSGEKRVPYTEEDCPFPLNVYGASKLAGEHFVRSTCPKHYVVRTAGLYGVAGSSIKGGNFVHTMIRLGEEGRPLKVVDDQVLSPTYAKDLALSTMALLTNAPYGLYHITNQGYCSWFEFARSILEWTGLQCEVKAVHSEVTSMKAKRPPFSALGNSGQTAQFVVTRSWEEALLDYLTFRSKVNDSAHRPISREQ
jgi:dTDP-4-dehydrorhamnose reductase